MRVGTRYHNRLKREVIDDFLAGNSINWITGKHQTTVSEIEQIVREALTHGTR
jgi:hypothetical protein